MSRRNDIDFLKGIAIIAVVLYHMGILKSGYLGVDVFFVIAGFLTVPSVLKKIECKQFSYVRFIWKRVIRLLPAILIVSVLCLVVGYFYWLPDDYENLSEGIIASIAFSNNILAGITTKNYWNAVNDYKPLMHMWYLGILMEFYLILPLFTIAFSKIAVLLKKDIKKVTTGGYCVLTLLSLILYLLPGASSGDKFYFIPYRFYELLLGGLVGINIDGLERFAHKTYKCVSWVSFSIVVLLLSFGIFSLDFSNIGVETIVIGQEAQGNALLLPNSVLVVLVVLFTSILLSVCRQNNILNSSSLLSAIGKRSYSIFVWHQVLLALYRYSVSNQITVQFFIAYILILCMISELSYRFIELKIKVNVKSSIVTIAVAFVICAFSGYLYIHAGVVRDVPELGISADNVHRNMHAEYCDRVYDYDVDFESMDKLKVLIIGNSFARDFGNILLESAYADDIELSYSFSIDDISENRIAQADRIFIFSAKDDVPDYVWTNAKDESIVYGIGTKSFGTLNGQIYFNRFNKDYFDQTVTIDPGYEAANNSLKEQWGDNYIDMMGAVTNGNQISVFSDANMFISQDTKHLTQAGAQYYSKILELEDILY